MLGRRVALGRAAHVLLAHVLRHQAQAAGNRNLQITMAEQAALIYSIDGANAFPLHPVS